MVSTSRCRRSSTRAWPRLVSNSYGDVGENVPLSSIRGQENLHIQAAGEGIGLYFSSGDNGDESASLGSAQPDFPASSPWVTSVGGTSLGIDKTGQKSFETGWGDVLDQIVSSPRGNVYAAALPGNLDGGGAGGGQSTLFDQPAYQKGVVPASLAGGKRVSPDLAALADPYTGFSIGIRPITDDTTLAAGEFVNETYGGTSLASPITAALSALVQQSTNTRLGFANPTLYATYRSDAVGVLGRRRRRESPRRPGLHQRDQRTTTSWSRSTTTRR